MEVFMCKLQGAPRPGPGNRPAFQRQGPEARPQQPQPEAGPAEPNFSEDAGDLDGFADEEESQESRRRGDLPVLPSFCGNGSYRPCHW